MHMMAKWQFRSLALNTMPRVSVVWILLQIYSVASTVTIPDLIGSKCYVKESDINIGVITQVYEKGTGELYCGRQLQNSRVLQVIEAVVWAIDEINKDDTILPNANLGYVILDDCGKEITATAQAMAFVKESQDGPENQSGNSTNSCQPRERQFDVVGVLGLEDSQVAQSVSNIMALFSIPVLSTLGRSQEDLSQHEREHEYLFYMTTPDHIQGKAMVNLMRHFGWTYSALIYSQGTYGEQGASYIQRLLEPNDTCVALVKRLRTNAKLKEFEQIFDELDKIQKASVVLLFLSDEHVKRFFETVAKREIQNKYIWIGSNTIASLSGPEVSGSFAIISNETVSGDFSTYYSSLIPENNPTNPWMKELWERLYNCSWQSSDPQLSCKNQTVPSVKQDILTETSKYIDAVYVLARALHKYIGTSCQLKTLSECLNGQELQSAIRSINFTGQTGHIQFGNDGNIQSGFLLKYYDNRTIRWLTLGRWSAIDDTIHVDDNLIDWQSYTGFRLNDNPENTVPLSVCSLNCTVKEYKLQGASTCCWECKRCKGNEIIIEGSGCQDCPFGMWPDESTSKICEIIDSTYLDWGDPKAIPLWFCSIIGMIGCVIIGVFFFIKRKNKLIRASNFELSAITLAGAFLSYMTMLVMIGKPNTGRCAMERFGFDNALAILVVPLMVKVNTSFRIYQASKKGNKDVVFIGRASQLAFCIGVLLMQIILATLSMVVVPPEAKSRMPNPTTERLLELHCHMPITGIILPLLFNLVMVLLCGYFGFSVFKLPDNFYESRCICISACLTWILWLCFMPIYFSAKYQVSKVISLEVCLLFNATLVIFIIFLPKLYAAYFVKDEDLKLTVNVIKTHPSQEISGLSDRRLSGTDSRRASGNHLQVGSPVAGSLSGGEHGHDENAILAAYVAKSGRRRSSTIRAIRKMDINKIAAVKETETPNATTSGT